MIGHFTTAGKIAEEVSQYLVKFTHVVTRKVANKSSRRKAYGKEDTKEYNAHLPKIKQYAATVGALLNLKARAALIGAMVPTADGEDAKLRRFEIMPTQVAKMSLSNAAVLITECDDMGLPPPASDFVLEKYPLLIDTIKGMTQFQPSDDEGEPSQSDVSDDGSSDGQSWGKRCS